ncbi:MAG: protein translocase subunit SecF [Oscillospiraceae bacterium]|nr:protein translocase subunit SecF [Oscillospiraceae bacterium]
MKFVRNMNLDFFGKRKLFLLISTVFILIGIVSMIISGFNLDADFIGGTSFTINLSRKITDGVKADIKAIIKDTAGFEPSSIQLAGRDGKSVLIKTLEVDSAKRESIVAKLIDKFELGEDFTDYQVSNVGASMTKDITRSLFLATIIAIALMLLYIWIRFDLYTGASAIICLFHDVFIMLTLYSIFQIPVNSNLVAAILTILGYSINNTIIVFDRIRENKKLSSTLAPAENVNLSSNRTFARMVNTTVTTLLTITMIYILGVTSIKNFALPLIIGLIAGFYSSSFLASPIWAMIYKEKKLKSKTIKA